MWSLSLTQMKMKCVYIMHACARVCLFQVHQMAVEQLLSLPKDLWNLSCYLVTHWLRYSPSINISFCVCFDFNKLETETVLTFTRQIPVDHVSMCPSKHTTVCMRTHIQTYTHTCMHTHTHKHTTTSTRCKHIIFFCIDIQKKNTHTTLKKPNNNN